MGCRRCDDRDWFSISVKENVLTSMNVSSLRWKICFLEKLHFLGKCKCSNVNYHVLKFFIHQLTPDITALFASKTSFVTD